MPQLRLYKVSESAPLTYMYPQNVMQHGLRAYTDIYQAVLILLSAHISIMQSKFWLKGGRSFTDCCEPQYQEYNLNDLHYHMVGSTFRPEFGGHIESVECCKKHFESILLECPRCACAPRVSCMYILYRDGNAEVSWVIVIFHYRIQQQ